MSNPVNPMNPLPPQQPYPPQQYGYEQPTVAQQPQPAFAHSPQAQNPAQYGVRIVDSLTANEFHVEINGHVVTGIFALSGLTPFKLRLDETGKPVDVVRPPLVLTKMVQQDPNLPFNAWVREAVQAQGKVLPTREITVVAMDEGVETRRWVFHNAWISEVTFSDFDTAVDYLVEEKITIQHGGVEEIWPQR